jgi:hypothetical protein
MADAKDAVQPRQSSIVNRQSFVMFRWGVADTADVPTKRCPLGYNLPDVWLLNIGLVEPKDLCH